MKVVFLHTDFRAYWPPRLRGLHAQLKERKIDLQVLEIAGAGSPYAFSGNSDNQLDWWQCLFPAEGMEAISSKRAVTKVIETLNETRPDIVFAGALAYPSGAAAVRWAGAHKKPVVIFDNARLADVPRSGLVNWVKRRMYANVDAVFIPAPSHVPDYQYWGIDPDRMFYGLNVVDNELWQGLSPNATDLDAVREELDLPESFFLGVGRQVAKKNWLRFLHAYHDYRQSMTKPFALVLVGDGPERDKLEEYDKTNNLGVRFVDFQQPEVLAKYYALAAANVLPSFHGETWGLTVNEAMACGTPVLVSKECGCCETLVVDGKTGFSFSPDNQKEMTDCLIKFSKLEPAELEQLGKNAQEHVSHWGLDRFCNGVLEAVNAVKDNRNGYASFVDRLIINLWNGRYRPT